MKTIAIDSNIFNYHFNRHQKFGPQAKVIFDLLSDNKFKAVTSIITLIELLSAKIEQTKLKAFQGLLLDIQNLTMVEVNKKIGIETASIRRKYNFRTPDAIQLATARLSKANVFVTNDRRLKAFRGVKVLLISEIAKILK